MKIEKGNSITRIWLVGNYAIRISKYSELIWLEYYRFGKDHMPDEIYADEDFEKVYNKYKEVR